MPLVAGGRVLHPGRVAVCRSRGRGSLLRNCRWDLVHLGVPLVGGSRYLGRLGESGSPLAGLRRLCRRLELLALPLELEGLAFLRRGREGGRSDAVARPSPRPPEVACPGCRRGHL